MLLRVLTLAEAREKAPALRKLAKAGADPVAERDRERRPTPTFAVAVKEAHEALKSGWSDRAAKAFLASLEEHAVPKLGSLKVDVIGGSDVITALAPIWQGKPVMARKVRSRIGQVLAFAKARGWRKDALPDARELRSGLAKQEQGKNFAAERCPTIPPMVAEMALAHKVGTATEQAYLRSDLRDLRRSLMDAWGRFVAPSLSGMAENVTAIRKAKVG
jgi:hypothetical protein